MSQYFDKDFFKFLFMFVAIITVSLLIVFMSRAYQAQTSVREEVTKTLS